MIQLRIHGRGGQGVVTAAEMLSIAAFHDGNYAQAFPSFGSERMGAPVVAFCRIDDSPIRLREPITAPDAIVIQDPTLLADPKLFAGLKPTGCAVINSSSDIPADKLGLGDLALTLVLKCVPATQIAREHVGRPLPNAAMLGALVGLTNVVSLDSLLKAISEKFNPTIAAKNHAAARAAFALTRQVAGEAVAVD